jgi:hypothetical protein
MTTRRQAEIDFRGGRTIQITVRNSHPAIEVYTYTQTDTNRSETGGTDTFIDTNS